MRNIIHKILWAALAVAVVLSIIAEVRPRTKGGSRLDALPLHGLGFIGRDLPLSAAETTVFHQARVVKRLYQAGGNRFILLAVDGGGDRHAIHDPIYCFRGAGWSVTAKAGVPLLSGQGQMLRLVKGSQTAEAVYWFTDGRHRHSSVIRLWWQSVLRRLGADSSSGEPLLIIMQPVAGSTLNWHEIARSFPQLLDL